MKRTLAVILVIAMLACMLPAFSFATTAAEDKDISGLNATLYQLKAKPDLYKLDGGGRYGDIIPGVNGYGADCSYGDSKHFDASIDQLLKISKINPNFYQESTDKLEVINQGDASNGYIMKWTGTVTAETSGTYYFVGRKIDNGFVAFVKQGDSMKKVYEYWAENHWFDGDNDRLVTDLGGFTLEAGVATEVEFWYLEATGGDAVTMNVSTSADGANDVSMTDAGLTLSLTRTCYGSDNVINHDRIYAVLPDGAKGGACVDDTHNKDNHDGNCSSCTDAGNHRYDATIAAVKAEMMELATVTLPSFEKDAFQGLLKYGFLYEDSLIEYTGYMTPSVSGEYQFGTTSVDNCLVIEIEINGVWTRLYEFWASRVWNDRSATYSDTKVTLEKDTAYPIRVTYLEIDGGEGLTTKVKIDGTEFGILEKVAFTTEKPTAPVKPTKVTLFDNSKEWYYTTSGALNEFQIRDNAWMTDPEVYTKWDKAANPGSKWGTSDDPVNNQSLWAVTTFDIENLADIEGYELMARFGIDDNIRVYVNGKLVQLELRWADHTWSFAEEATDLLKEGTNTIAMKLVQGWGGSSVTLHELWLTLEDNGNAPYEFKYFDKDGVKQDGRIYTADQFLAYVADANARGDENRDDRISIEADLDFSGKEWTPFTKYIGRIFGNGHTFKNISYTATVDASGAGEGTPVGLLFTSLANNNANGLLYDLILDNCHLTVNAVEGAGKEKAALAGIVAGMVDRGMIENVTVKNSSISGNASYAAGIAGVACWNYNDNGVHVENCATINTTIEATVKASGILAWARGGDRVTLGNCYVEDITLDAPASSLDLGGTWGWGENVKHYSTTTVGKNYLGQTIAPVDAYNFHYQTRDNGDGTKDYRIFCVTTEDWILEAESIDVAISFTNGTDTKSITVSPESAYRTIKAEHGNVVDVYTGGEGTVIFGWVIENVPADYAGTPSVTLQ